MTANMKAWQYGSTTGGIEKHLTINDAAPRPTIKDNELLIEIHAAALNPIDYKLTEGPIVLRLLGSNLIPLADYCGKVVETGKNVDKFRVGEWVFGAKLGELKNGTLAQYCAVPAHMAVLLPEGIKVEDAAGVGIVGLTELQALKPNVKSGDHVFINGGSGGTGVYGLQIAKALGCHVTTSCSTANVEFCKSLGADEVIDYKKEDIVQTLSAKGPIFSLVVDNIGTPQNLYKSSDTFLLPAGKFVQVGGGLSLGALMQTGSKMVLPSFLGGGKHSFQQLMAKASSDDLEQLAAWMKEGKLKGVVDSAWEWEDAPKAFEKLKTGRAKGKVVIKVPHEKA